VDTNGVNPERFTPQKRKHRNRLEPFMLQGIKRRRKGEIMFLTENSFTWAENITMIDEVWVSNAINISKAQILNLLIQILDYPVGGGVVFAIGVVWLDNPDQDVTEGLIDTVNYFFLPLDVEYTEYCFPIQSYKNYCKIFLASGGQIKFNGYIGSSDGKWLKNQKNATYF
jgi:hypothetical protein